MTAAVLNEFMTEQVRLDKSMPIDGKTYWWAEVADLKTSVIAPSEWDVTAAVYVSGRTRELRLLNPSGDVIAHFLRWD